MDRRRHEPDAVDERDVDLPEADNDDVQAEGDYRPARQFQWEEHAFSADEHRVKRVAREAANSPDEADVEPAGKPRRTAGKGRAG